MNWILTKERVPDKSGRYLVSTFEGAILILDYTEGTKDYFEFVTAAWMPLPEPARLENV